MFNPYEIMKVEFLLFPMTSLKWNTTLNDDSNHDNGTHPTPHKQHPVQLTKAAELSTSPSTLAPTTTNDNTALPIRDAHETQSSQQGIRQIYV